MSSVSYRRHRFPPVVIQHAVWLYLRFTLSYRDVEELLAERGLDGTYETVHSWVVRPSSRRGGDAGHLEMAEHLISKRLLEVISLARRRAITQPDSLMPIGAGAELRPCRTDAIAQG